MNASCTSAKREKPYPGFPLCWHQSGYWCKKIEGRFRYFGPRWGDWQTALEEYERLGIPKKKRSRGAQERDARRYTELVSILVAEHQKMIADGLSTRRQWFEALCVRLGVDLE